MINLPKNSAASVNTMLAALVAISTLTVLPGCKHQTLQAPPPVAPALEAPLPLWQANYPATNYLASEVPLQEYAIRPPLGYHANFTDLPSRLQPYGLGIFMWSNDENALNYSSLDIEIVQRRTSYDALTFLNSVLGPSKRDISDFVQTKPETGTINGATFARTYWQGTEKKPSGNYSVSGFTYVTTQPTGAIMIEGKDTVPCANEPCHYQPLNGAPMLPTLEAAALTFRRL